MKKPKIWWYTFTYNDAFIIPHMIEYWKVFADHVVVYDNSSEDETSDILSQYSFIEVRQINSENNEIFKSYNARKIQEIKNTCWHEARGKADYVVISDIFETIKFTDTVLDELSLAKQNNITVFKTQLSDYCVLQHGWPQHHKDTLLQFSGGTYRNRHEYQKNVMMFSPDINLEFSDFQQNANYGDQKTQDLYFISFKCANNKYFLASQNYFYNNDCNFPQQYKYNALDYISFFNKHERRYVKFTENKFPEEAYLLSKYKETNVNIAALKLFDIPWQKQYNVQNLNEDLSKDCVVVIPVYKTSDMKYEELVSIQRIIQILGEKYNICLVGPENLYFKYFQKKFNYNFSYLQCNPLFFKNLNTYSYLCEKPEFYQAFSDFKYMFIIQPDGWIFYDNVQYFMDQNYDYWGSPWEVGTLGFNEELVGNGGVSLRKIDSFIKICKKITPEMQNDRFIGLEDNFFCHSVQELMGQDAIKIPSSEKAMYFALDANPEVFLPRMSNKLPMALHAWYRYEAYFWEKYIKNNLKTNYKLGDALQ